MKKLILIRFMAMGVGFWSLESIPSVVAAEHRPYPILMQHCWTCHGGPAQEAELDLRSRSNILKGGRSGPAVIPGKPDESPLIQRIRDGACPPNRRLVEANVKPVPDSSLKLLSYWIADGAPEEASPPDIAGTSEDPLVKEKDRDFWAFRPPQRTAVPTIARSEVATRVRNPVDAFIAAKLLTNGLSLNPEASKQVLLRRVFFDLLGLPPSPEEAAAFLEDESPKAYERLVDRLLESPRYGERWGRYWLDIAGYSDVEGKREQHMPRPHNYRYRDYVIRAFNDDKPYARFLTEQLAGDELADYENAPEISQEIYDNLVATAFLRQGPDPTWANITGFVPDRLDVIGDAMDVLGSGVLGLTMKCARCHNHKFDPLPARDYYRLTDIFKGVLDEYDWLKPGLQPYGGAGNSGPLKERTLPYVTTAERTAWEKTRDRIQTDITNETRKLEQEEKSVRSRFLDAEIAKLPEPEQALARNYVADPKETIVGLTTNLVAKFAKTLNPDRSRLKEFDAEFRRRSDALAALVRTLPSEPRVAALWDRGQPSPTYIYLRGDPQRMGSRVHAGIPAVLAPAGFAWTTSPPWPDSRKTGRRLALARWLTQPDHPLTSRVAVNRIWKHHFGRGLVKTLDNLGRTGAAPTHPELLDWLAVTFVEGGWRWKPLHRLLLTSAVYRQSSQASEASRHRDPENLLWSRMPLQRLDAEALWDACISVAGARDDTQFGPAVPVVEKPDGTVTPGKQGDRWRRSIYGQQTRKSIPTLLESFDLPPMNPNCVQRGESNVPTQALNLLNDSLLRELAGRFASRVEHEAPESVDARVTRAFQIAYARDPEPEERAASRRLLDQDPDTHQRMGLTVLCRMLMNSAEFLYVD